MADFNVGNLTVGNVFQINDRRHLYSQENGEHIITPLTPSLDNPNAEFASKTEDFATNTANPNYNNYLGSNIGSVVVSRADGETYDSPNFLFYTDGSTNANQWNTKINGAANFAGQAPIANPTATGIVGVDLNNWTPFSVSNLGRTKRLISNGAVNQNRYIATYPLVAGWQTVIDFVYRTHEDSNFWPFLFSIDNEVGTTTHPGAGFFRNNSDTQIRAKVATNTQKTTSDEPTAVNCVNIDNWQSYRILVNSTGRNVTLWQNATQIYNIATLFACNRLHIGNQNTGQNQLRWELDALSIFMLPNNVTVGATTGLSTTTCFGRSSATATGGVYIPSIPEVEFRDMYDKSIWVPQIQRGNVTAYYVKTGNIGNVGVSTANYNKDLSATANGAWYKILETEDPIT